MLPAIALVLAGTAPAATHRYAVHVDADLRRLQVEARFAAPVRNIRARSRNAASYLEGARDCGSDLAITASGRRLSLPSSGIECLSYAIDLERAAADERRNATLSKENVVVSPAAWLWRPALTADDAIEARFVLEGDNEVSLPWQPLPDRDNHYLLAPSPRNAAAVAVFGRFLKTEADVPGARLRIAILRPRDDIDEVEIVDWLRDAARNVSLTYGRFPNPLPHVVVIPVGRSGWSGDSPVPFGRVLRDGGESVEFFVDQGRPVDDFYADWTGTHEFSHLMLPYVRSNHRWISEGFAQYYQNVLLARAGRYSEQHAWQKLYEGFERGRQSRPDLTPNEAARAGVGAATMRIYWSGAVIALMADVELRQRTRNRQSLDRALDELQACCLPSPVRWSGTQLFEALDGFVDAPVFMPLYRRYADDDDFPDFRPLFERLGVIVENGRVSLSNDAELADIRRAITAVY